MGNVQMLETAQFDGDSIAQKQWHLPSTVTLVASKETAFTVYIM